MSDREPKDEIGVVTSGHISGPIGGTNADIKWNIRGTGLWAGAIVVGGVIFYEMNWRSPTTNAGQFMVTLFLAFVCGILVGTAAQKGRLADALREKEQMRGEMQRMAEEKGALYDRVLSQRLSSGGSPPKKKK